MSDSSGRILGETISLAHHLVDLQKNAVSTYEPIVNSIVVGRSIDVHHIENTLDGLLDFAGCDAGLRLFKTLCRHYWKIDPTATASYIQSYREMWDNDGAGTLQSSNSECVTVEDLRHP